MAAVVTVVADDRGRWYDARATADAGDTDDTAIGAVRTKRTFRIAERAHARTRAVIRMNGRLTYRWDTRVSVTRAVRATVRRWQLGMGEA